MQKRKRIYLDYAGATPVDRRVLKEMEPFWDKNFGNPASLHSEGVFAKRAVAEAREKVASELHAGPQEVIFVSGGTEANNLAILGFAGWLEENGCSLKDAHFITLSIEHPSVLECVRSLEKRGVSVSYIPVTGEGIIDISVFEKELKNNTVFVSLQFVNSEIGTVEPIREVAKILRRHRKKTSLSEALKKFAKPFPFFHTDASQAPLFYNLNVEKLGVDYLSLDGQKMYGPKGVGALYVRKDAPLAPLFYGGDQEGGLRPGTENVSGIVGFAKALEIAGEEREETSRSLTKLRDYFIQKLLVALPSAEFNGHTNMRSPNNVNISIPGIDAEWVVIELNARGIAIGTKSACLSEDGSGSYVIRALGKSDALARSTLRFTLGKKTTKADIDCTVGALSVAVKLDKN